MSRRKQSNPQHVHTNDLDTKKSDTKTSPGHTMEIVKEDISGDQNRQSVSCPSTNELSRRTSSTESSHSLAESESPVSNTVHAERKYECSSCGVSFLQKSTLEVHKENYCTGQRYKMECKVCGAKFSDNDMFEMHMEVHMWKFTCHICQTHYETQEAYDRHFAAHVTKPNGSCSICEYKSRSPDDMTKHLKVHRNYLELSSTDERLPQPPKPKSPSAVKREEAHTSKELGNGRLSECRKASPISEQNTPRKFKCIVCSDSFGEVDSLQQHLLTAHASVQPTKPVPNLKETPQHPFRRHSIAVNRIEHRQSTSRNQTISGMKRKFSDVERISASTKAKFQKFDVGNQIPLESKLKDKPPYISRDHANYSPERYRCTECDISFESQNNFRVHKSHYCSHRNVLVNEQSSNPVRFTPQTEKTIAKQFSIYAAECKTKDVHPYFNLSADGRQNPAQEPRRSKERPPQSPEQASRLFRKTSSRNSRKAKKYECKECCIQFSKFDTYLAHKKYYCESRRGDRMAEINRTPPRDKVSESSSSSDVETYPTPRSRRPSLKTAAPLRIEHDMKTSEGQAETEFPYRDLQMFLGDPAHMSAILTPLMKHYFYTLKQNVQLEMEADGSATLEKQSRRRDSSSMRPAHLRTTSKQRNIKTEQSNSSRNSPDSRMLRLVAVQSSPEARSLSPPRMQIPVSIKQESATTY